MIAALFVEPFGPYYDLPGVDIWPEARDARKYPGPWPVVAHPPCERWGRYWHGGPSAKVRRIKGDDGGCFASALASVRRFGGVLEHPAHTHAWKAFGLQLPVPGRWSWQPGSPRGAWVCEVSQAAYGHRARKLTWLYYVGYLPPLQMVWSVPSGLARLDAGFHSAAERRAAGGQRAVLKAPRLSKKENLETPVAFRDMLLALASRAGEKP